VNVTYRLPNTIVAFFFFLAAAITPTSLLASDAGGGGAPAPLIFTVNLGPNNYLQIGLILQAATPETSHELGVFQPRIKHEIILLLSGRDEALLRTLPGKKALIEEIIASVNHVIHSDEKSGVNEVLLSNFIIQ
jgi:flagellar FliL protein